LAPDRERPRPGVNLQRDRNTRRYPVFVVAAVCGPGVWRFYAERGGTARLPLLSQRAALHSHLPSHGPEARCRRLYRVLLGGVRKCLTEERFYSLGYLLVIRESFSDALGRIRRIACDLVQSAFELVKTFDNCCVHSPFTYR
jgi:hypothetical protein